MSHVFYHNNIKTVRETIGSLEKQMTRNSFLRLAIMIGGGILVFQLFKTNNIFLVVGTIIGVILLFIYLVFRHSKLERKLEERKVFLQINENEIKMIEENKNIYADGTAFEDPKHPYTGDLDIFGPHSLFSKINRCATKDGITELAGWLLKAAGRADILERQEASTELSEDPEHLQSFQTKMLFNLGSKVNLRTYIQSYFHDRSMAFGNAFMRLYVPVAPWIFLAGILVSLFLFNISSYLIMLGIVHLLWTMSQAGKVSQFSNKIDKIGVSLIAFADAIKLIEDRKYHATLNKTLQSKLSLQEQDKKLSSVIRELGQLIDKLDARNNMLVGAILNMIFLWDFKQVMAINKWKDSYQDTIVSGFDAISIYESLISLAILRYNFPHWVLPSIQQDFINDHLRAEELNHPLISSDKSVANDYSSEDHQIALITGSNMAGKSTFLRTVGVNAVLAYAGAVVCAKQFSIPIYELVTYMRIKDSLNESTSTFKAELDRMKFILERVEEIPASYFLIDEMLRGTNSVDKYLGSKAIIKKLIGLKGKGMLATHDLQLAEMAKDYPQNLKNYHFDIQVHGAEMLFDYKLKDGPCTIFNASLLLKGIGVLVENEN
ncbi:DNA mismatch repair protein MutS [Sphingobacterium sp. DK4209]|uniref:DNA mismatch repair protein MutS n=1 Tax=Sphingobacterium zhuxiongii TaxID=2662364 RepID=A0A5Q0Q642_9SPHI|nr:MULTISPECIES: DNA mismatch repair protein MutS [unclassified Sphingobacterium]MVZ67179.1 DNA mismatch repair protein MutS [Sphingobacterium sp. DK4209]QGA25507.1 DNA mismatch repair protein MutS [Sphingobacterium sp. dk4302]